MSIRDTQFQGFAKLLLKELAVNNTIFGITDSPPDWGVYWTNLEKLIARRAYDLAIEVAKQAIDGNSYDEERDARRILEKLGDMTELPKQQE